MIFAVGGAGEVRESVPDGARMEQAGKPKQDLRFTERMCSSPDLVYAGGLGRVRKSRNFHAKLPCGRYGRAIKHQEAVVRSQEMGLSMKTCQILLALLVCAGSLRADNPGLQGGVLKERGAQVKKQIDGDYAALEALYKHIHANP